LKVGRDVDKKAESHFTGQLSERVKCFNKNRKLIVALRRSAQQLKQALSCVPTGGNMNRVLLLHSRWKKKDDQNKRLVVRFKDFASHSVTNKEILVVLNVEIKIVIQ